VKKSSIPIRLFTQLPGDKRKSACNDLDGTHAGCGPRLEVIHEPKSVSPWAGVGLAAGSGLSSIGNNFSPHR